MTKTFNLALWGDNSNGQNASFKEWAQSILNFCQEESMYPDYPSLKLKNGKPSNIKLSTFRQRLLKHENTDIEWISLTKSQPDFSYIATDWEFNAFLISEQWFNNFYIGFDLGKFSLLYTKKFEILFNMLTYIYVDYGFCFYMNSDMGPSLYVSGILISGKEQNLDKFDRESNSVWRNYQPEAIHSVKKGKLKYLYEYNIINASHLKRNIFGKSLENWISSSPENGTLRPLNDRLYLWTVEPSRLSSLIQSLMDQNIFLLDKNLKPNFD